MADIRPICSFLQAEGYRHCIFAWGVWHLEGQGEGFLLLGGHCGIQLCLRQQLPFLFQKGYAVISAGIQEEVLILYQYLVLRNLCRDILVIKLYLLHLGGCIPFPAVYNPVPAEIIVAGPVPKIPAICLEFLPITVFFGNRL